MPEPSNEQWLDLYQAFREYCESAPWEWLDNSDVVAVEHPSGEYKGYCVVLGDGGIEYGLAVYNGDEGLAHYLELMAGELGGETPEVLDTMDALSALLADREVLSTTDRDIIRNLGLRYRGRGKWPIFRSIKPGYAPWRPEADEAVFLTQALRVTMGIAARVEAGELALYLDGSPDLILTQVLRQGEWHDQWETLTPPPPALAPDYPDAARLQQLAESKARSSNTLEFGIFYLYSPVQPERGQRPFFPTVVAIGDPVSGMVFPENLWGVGPTTADHQESLVKLLESLPFLPAELVVDRPQTAQLVVSVAGPLGIQLAVDETPAIWSFQADMTDFFDR